MPRGSYRRATTMHPAFQECIRRLYLLPTRPSMAAIQEHTEMHQVAARLSEQTGTPVKLPSYDQACREIHRLKSEPELVAVREGAESIPRARESAESFALSIPAPALLTQVDEHSLELYYDRRDVGVLYLFVEGAYVGEAYCPQLMGGRASEWEAKAMRKQDEIEAKAAREQG